MAVLERTFPAGFSVDDMRKNINEHLLPNPQSKMLIGDNPTWEGDTLKFKSGLGEGKITLGEQEVKFWMDLSMFGGMAKGQIEEALTKQFPRMFAPKE